MDRVLDAHAKPPVELRAIYKEFHKAKASSLPAHPDLVQFQDSTSKVNCNVELKRCLDLPAEIRQVFNSFLCSNEDKQDFSSAVYEVPEVPGKTEHANHILHPNV